MGKLEKQIISLISQLNRTALLRVMHVIIEKLQADDTESEISPEQWERMNQAVADYEAGNLKTISRSQLESELKALRNK